MGLACPRLVPSAGHTAVRPEIVAGCSGGPNMTSVPLTSKQCRFAEWSYLAGSDEVPGSIPNHTTFTSNLPPPPPSFVHVLVYAAANRSDLHPWPSLFRYRISRVQHASKLAPNPACPQILNVLKAIVYTARVGRS